MAGITQKINVAAFPLRFLQKQNGWIKRRENNMKDIIRSSIAYWRVYIKWGTLNETRVIDFQWVIINFFVTTTLL